MPRGNGTGPSGMGPMTGRGTGFCAGYAQAGPLNPAMPTRGICGGGYGHRNMYYATGLPYRARENVQTGSYRENLEGTLKLHEEAIGNIRKKLDELNKTESGK